MDRAREEICSAVSVPASMSAILMGYEWARNNVGQSGANVYRLHGKLGAPDLFFKHGTADVADALVDEMSRLRWMAGRVPAPTVTHFTNTADEAWLLMTALPGKTAYDVMAEHADDRMAVVDALARFLRQLHAVPVSQCPFSSNHRLRLDLARQRIDAGLVDEDDFDEEREAWTPEQVWDEIQKMLPVFPDLVVAHGDFSLDNLLMVNGEIIGCIDVGRAGVADRYQDISILWNCLGEFDPALQEAFLKRYGLSDPDVGKLSFHLMLDELF